MTNIFLVSQPRNYHQNMSQTFCSTNHHPHIKTYSHRDLNIKTHSHREPHHQQSTKPRKFPNPPTSTKTHSPLTLIAAQPDPDSTLLERARATTILVPIATHISPTTSLSQPKAQPTSTSISFSTMATLKRI